VLVLVLVFQLLRDRSVHPRSVALLTAAIFGVHPLRVESVAWATERKDVLFAFFYLLALLAYLRWLDRGKPNSYWMCLLLFIGSALSKSTAVTFPFVLMILDWFWKRRIALSEKVPFFAVSLLVGAATFVAQASGTGETVLGVTVIPLWARLGLVGYCTVFYVGKFFWPFHLSAVYPTFEDFGWTPLIAVGYLVAFCALLGAALALRRRAPIMLPSWLFYLVTLSPTIGLIPVGAHVVADRYAYMALLGLALPTSLGLVAVANKLRPLRLIVSVAIVMLLTALTILSAKRAAVWTSTETLFQNALAEDPTCYTALVNLTVYYTSANRLDSAIDCGQRAVQLAPNGLIGRKNLAIALTHAKRYREAIQILRPAIEHGIDDPVVWRVLKESFDAVGDKQNANIAEARMLRSTQNKP
jgi:protein O-mannosyl-transferase